MAVILCKQVPHSLIRIVTTQLNLSTKLEDYSVQLVLFEQTNVQLSAITFMFNYLESQGIK